MMSGRDRFTMDMVTRSKDVLFFKRNKQIVKWVAIIGLLFTLMVLAYFFSIDLFNQPELIASYLEQSGAFAPILYFFVSIVNTIYPLIPGGLGNVIGFTVFGPVAGFALAYSANLIGSFILFTLAKRFGKPILYAFLDEKIVTKCLSYLEKGYYIEWILAVVFVVPGLPDDVFTMISGLSDLTYKRLLWLQLLCKPLTMFLYMMGVNNLLAFLSNLI